MLALLLTTPYAFADDAAGCGDITDMDTWACLIAEAEQVEEETAPPAWLDVAEQSTAWDQEALTRIPAGRSITEVVRMSPGTLGPAGDISNGWPLTAGGGVGPMMVIVDGVRVGPLPATDHNPVGLR